MPKSHPDIVMNEPIPQIDPRIDHLRLEIVRILNRWWTWCTSAVILMMFVFMITHPPMSTRVILLVIILIFWILPFALPKHRKLLAQQREQHRLAHGMHNPRVDYWCIPFRDNAMHTVMTIGLILTAPLLMGIDQGLAASFTTPGCYLFMGGIGIIIIGFRARQPGQISCEYCSYPLVGLSLPCMCPECGRSLLDAGFTTDRPRIRSPWFTRIGTAASLLGAVFLYISFARPGLIYSSIPSTVLLKLAPSDRDALDRYLATATTQQDTDRLIELLINSNPFNHDAYRSYSQRQWLAQQFAAGVLTDEQVNRIIEPYLELSIAAPATARIGEPITLRISTAQPFESARDLNPNYYFAGFVLGQDPTPHERSRDPEALEELPENNHDTQNPRRPPISSPEYAFIPDEAGPLTIRARIVIAVFPRRTSPTIDWTGDPRFPAPPLWTRTLDLQRTIAVTDP